MYVDDIQLTGRTQNISSMWKVLSKEVDLGERTSFLDHVYLGCTERQGEMSKNIVDNFRVQSLLHERHEGACTGLSVFDYSETCFRELQRSDPIHQERCTIQPQSCVEGNDFGFC